MRKSRVIKTFSEIKSQMERDNSSASAIQDAKNDFEKKEEAVSKDYKKVSAKFDATLAKQNQGNES